MTLARIVACSFVSIVLAACSGGPPVAGDDPAAEPAENALGGPQGHGQASVSGQGQAPVGAPLQAAVPLLAPVRADVPLGVREELRKALGQPVGQPLDAFTPPSAVVGGVLEISHFYSWENLVLTAPSWDHGTTGDGQLNVPSIFDNLDARAMEPAKRLFDAMTAASSTTVHNAVANYDVITRSSAAGIVVCTHVTPYSLSMGAGAPSAIPDQYRCTIKGVSRVRQTLAGSPTP